MISTQVTYESDHISLLRDSTMPSALNFVFYVFYCNVKEKYHIRRTVNSKKRVISEISIIIILICTVSQACATKNCFRSFAF